MGQCEISLDLPPPSVSVFAKLDHFAEVDDVNVAANHRLELSARILSEGLFDLFVVSFFEFPPAAVATLVEPLVLIVSI